MRKRLLLWPALVALAAGCGRIDYEALGGDPKDGGPAATMPDAAEETPPDASADEPANPWWDAAWSHRMQLGFDNSLLSEKLIDVPIPVFLNESRIDIDKVQSDGSDLRFVAADHQTELPHELELWVPAGGDVTSGSAVLWVRVPVLDPENDDNHIWLYYGNSTASASERPAEVWASGYAGVWHLSEDGGVTRADATGNANELAAPGEVPSTQGKLAGAAELSVENAASLPLERDDTSQKNLDLGTELTLEAWIRPASTADIMTIVAKVEGSTNQAYKLKRLADETIELALSFDCTNLTAVTGSALADAGRWHHVAAVYDGKAMRVYLDGFRDAELLHAGGAPCDSAAPFMIGALAGGSTPFDGVVDEVRVSRSARSKGWLEVQYKAMLDDLIAYGAEEPRP